MMDGWHRVLVRRRDDLDRTREGYDFGQDWEWDPIEQPGEVHHLGSGYVSTTRLTPDHVYLWLLQPQNLDDERAICFWETMPWRDAHGPAPALRSPPFTPARQIEAALHDGRIETALRAESISITNQVKSILDGARRAANSAEHSLMERWSRDAKPTNTDRPQS